MAHLLIETSDEEIAWNRRSLFLSICAAVAAALTGSFLATYIHLSRAAAAEIQRQESQYKCPVGTLDTGSSCIIPQQKKML